MDDSCGNFGFGETDGGGSSWGGKESLKDIKQIKKIYKKGGCFKMDKFYDGGMEGGSIGGSGPSKGKDKPLRSQKEVAAKKAGLIPPKKAAIKPPTPADFSQEAIRKVVKSSTIQHWTTLYPIALGAAGGLAAFLISPVFAFVALGGLGIGAGSWAINYFVRKDALADKYIRQLREEMAKYRASLLENLREELAECREIKGGEEYARQGEEQFVQVKEKFEAFQEILSRKLNQGELTYARYLGTAEQVYLATLDNLRDIVNLLRSADAIDVEYVARKLKEFERQKSSKQDDLDEIAAIKKSRDLYDKQMNLVNKLLARNEEALTQIDETTAKLAMEMKTGSEARVDLETARKELEELAKRAREYSRDAE